jgi:hypothetical protein
MRVDHRRLDVAMAQQLLNRSNVRVDFQQVWDGPFALASSSFQERELDGLLLRACTERRP